MGLIVAVRTVSRTAREPCAAGASWSLWLRRWTKPSRGDGPARRWRDREAAARVVSVHVRGACHYVSEEDLRSASETLAEYVAQQSCRATVIPLRKKI